ncbi:tmRNA tag peptide, partial [Helicobacter cinaedi CCUG 18818 = ATCC BAA-847]
ANNTNYAPAYAKVA